MAKQTNVRDYVKHLLEKAVACGIRDTPELLIYFTLHEMIDKKQASVVTPATVAGHLQVYNKSRNTEVSLLPERIIRARLERLFLPSMGFFTCDSASRRGPRCACVFTNVRWCRPLNEDARILNEQLDEEVEQE